MMSPYRVDGGGITGQVDAVRLGIARALVKIDAEHKPKLKAEELMTRDPRAAWSVRNSDARKRVSVTSSASVKVPTLVQDPIPLDSPTKRRLPAGCLYQREQGK
jgi:hypothetical protein